MGANSKIEWTDHTFNPWIGCTKVSPGCENCYAAAQDKFRKWTPEGFGKGKPRKRTSAANWNEPLKWNRTFVCRHCGESLSFNRLVNETHTCKNPSGKLEVRWSRVFCGSLCDWLDDDVPIEWMVDLLGMIYFGCHLDWQLLTKRPENWLPRMVKAMQHIENFGGVAALHEWILGWVACSSIGKPPKNVWIGTTVENQEMADKRIPALLKIPARVHFLSCEPLLGPVDLPVFTHPSGANIGVDWVICGGESGKDARPMHPNWARGLREQCAAAGVPYFFKQWGKWAPCIHDAYRASDSWTVIETDGSQHHPLAGYEGSGKVMCHCGKCHEAHGRLLDGKEHNGFPVIAGRITRPSGLTRSPLLNERT